MAVVVWNRGSGGNPLHRGPGGMKRKFQVSYGGGVCDSYMIIHISYSSLNPRRIKLVISKLYIPQTWVNSVRHHRCHSRRRSSPGHFSSWPCPSASCSSSPSSPLLMKTFSGSLGTVSLISGLSPFRWKNQSHLTFPHQSHFPVLPSCQPFHTSSQLFYSEFAYMFKHGSFALKIKVCNNEIKIVLTHVFTSQTAANALLMTAAELLGGPSLVGIQISQAVLWRRTWGSLEMWIISSHPKSMPGCLAISMNSGTS